MARLPEIRYPRFLRNGGVLSGPRWQLSCLSLEQHPDKTFIGRTQRGFDFLFFSSSLLVVNISQCREPRTPHRENCSAL